MEMLGLLDRHGPSTASRYSQPERAAIGKFRSETTATLR